MKLLTAQDINRKLLEMQSNLYLIESTLISSTKLAKFIDKNYNNEEFYAKPKYVLCGDIKGHPKSRGLRIKQFYKNKKRPTKTKYTEQQIRQRIYSISGNKLHMIAGTFKTVRHKADFIHADFPHIRFSRLVANVLYLKIINHPITLKNKRPTSKLSLSEALDKIAKRNPHIHLCPETYIDTKIKAKFYEDGIDEPFWAKPNAFISGNQQGHPLKKLERIKKTSLMKYGVDNAHKNREVHLRSLRSANKKYKLTHWKTNEILFATASYEKCTIEWLNKNKINFIWQPFGFTCSTGRVYFVDLYLPDEDKYIEIKGYERSSFKEKWNEFKVVYPTAEIWFKEQLTERGIL